MPKAGKTNKKPIASVKKALVKKSVVKKASVTQIIEIKNTNVEEKIEQSKYFVPPRTLEQAPKRENDIPHNYGKDKIVLLVRDPRWVHAYWELTENKYNEVRQILGEAINTSREILRVYDTTQDPWRSFDITVFCSARSWYVNIPNPGSTYLVEIGYLTADGRFIMMARSNSVTTPREGMSDVIDEEWMTIDFDRIYALSGGFGIGKSSGEIKKLMEKHMKNQSASGWITSASSPFGGQPERPFFLVANTELIVYGATEPTAKLYVQGKRVNIMRDGTFSLRFALPDGQQVIPIEAIRDDDQEKRSITPTVEKRTK
jgi:uncharacterized protein